MEHKITTENILKAAEKFPEFKEALKTMFPEAFKEEKYFDLSRLRTRGESCYGNSCFTSESLSDIGLPSSKDFIGVRSCGAYDSKGFYLSDNVNWELKKDDQGYTLLIPTRK